MNEAIDIQNKTTFLIFKHNSRFEDVTWGERTGAPSTIIGIPKDTSESEDITWGQQSDSYNKFLINLYSSPFLIIDRPLTKLAWEVVLQTTNKDIAEVARSVLSLIDKKISDLKNSGSNLDNLPELDAVNLEDGSLLIEWMFDDFRIGFSFEPELPKSGWYLVSKENLGTIHATGHFSNAKSEIEFILDFGYSLSQRSWQQKTAFLTTVLEDS